MRKHPSTQIPKYPSTANLSLGQWALGPWALSSLGFHALGSAWLFALIAPLVLFYFLKLKRPRLTVPSLVLWRQVVQDKRVNSPFQRFKRNLLLLLQLLLLILLVTAALQPFLQPKRLIQAPALAAPELHIVLLTLFRLQMRDFQLIILEAYTNV